MTTFAQTDRRPESGQHVVINGVTKMDPTVQSVASPDLIAHRGEAREGTAIFSISNKPATWVVEHPDHTRAAYLLSELGSP